MSEIKDRINELACLFSDGNVTALAKKIRISPSSLTKHANGGRNPKLKSLKRICDNLGVNVLWLAEGKGEMLVSSRVNMQQQENPDKDKDHNDAEDKQRKEAENMPVGRTDLMIRLIRFAETETDSDLRDDALSLVKALADKEKCGLHEHREQKKIAV